MITQVFIDYSMNVFVHTSDNLLYVQDDDRYYPLKCAISEPKKCFAMGKDRVAVYHGNRLDIFDRAYDISPQNRYLEYVVDDVYYYPSDDILILLCDGRCMIHIKASKKKSICVLLGNGQISKCFLTGSCLSCYFNGQADYYQLNGGEVVHRHSLPVSLATYNASNLLFDELDIAELKDLLHRQNRFHFLSMMFYIVIQGVLYCTYDSTHISPLIVIGFIEKDLVESFEIKEQGDMSLMQIHLNVPVLVQNHDTCQVICVGDKLFVVRNSTITPLTFNEKMVTYDNTQDAKFRHIVTIDITEQDIFQQMNSIIPAIYRLGHRSIYRFNMVDEFGHAKSYGSGVDRHVATATKGRIAELLTDVLTIPDQLCVKIGKLIYFLAINNQERFENIHPYFFFLLCKNSRDHRHLLRILKDKKSVQYYDTYAKNIQELRDLDIGLDSLDDYTEHVISGSLCPQSKAKYQKMVEGYQNYCDHSIRKSYYRNVPVTYYLASLIKPPDIMYKYLFPIMPGNHDYLLQMQRIVREKIKAFTPDQQRAFIKNITNSHDFTDIIIITAMESAEIKVSYVISSCEASLIFYNNPSMEIVEQIIDLMTIEDSTLIN